MGSGARLIAPAVRGEMNRLGGSRERRSLRANRRGARSIRAEWASGDGRGRSRAGWPHDCPPADRGQGRRGHGRWDALVRSREVGRRVPRIRLLSPPRRPAVLTSRSLIHILHFVQFRGRKWMGAIGVIGVNHAPGNSLVLHQGAAKYTYAARLPFWPKYADRRRI
jgi:hypothetical protein